MSLTLIIYHGCKVWVACNGTCRFVVSRQKAAEIFASMKAGAAV
ncbi:hypothetical protein [Vibrio sp. Isolate24]|nr:hypothetical protein [Vibrio sp. Isolate24]